MADGDSPESPDWGSSGAVGVKSQVSKGREVTLSVSEGRRWEGSCVLSRRPREIALDQSQS